MQCDEFETRLNELLDERQPFERDPQLRAHTLSCGGCRRLAAGYGALSQGIEELPLAEADAALAWHVVAECHAQRQRRRVVRYSFAGLAAAVLIALTLRSLPQAPEVVHAPPTVPQDGADDGNGIENAPRMAPTEREGFPPPQDEPADDRAERHPAEESPRDTFDRNLALARETRQTLAGAWLLVPGVPTPSVPAPDDADGGWDRPVADELKPLADSTAGALGFLLHVLPSSGRGQQASPAVAPGT